MKACTKCLESKPLDCFYRHGPVNRAAGREYQAQCKDCIRANRRQRRATAHGRQYALGYRLRAEFGITLEDYERMAEAQGYKCALCEKPETATRDGLPKRLAVDHCHESGRIRGLLCTRCNTAIGLLKDDPALMLRAAEYLA